MIKLEFFHDVICCFCFPMSEILHRIAAAHENIEVIHRSFALAWDEKDYVSEYGSREAVKDEILKHWDHANRLDPENRMNIDGMKDVNFNFPLSRPALCAAKAAGLAFGEGSYWRLFDALQKKFFIESQNIEQPSVIENAVVEAGLDLQKWKRQLSEKTTEKAVLEDLRLASAYGIEVVPTLILDGKYSFGGALSETEVLKKISEYERLLNC